MKASNANLPETPWTPLQTWQAAGTPVGTEQYIRAQSGKHHVRQEVRLYNLSRWRKKYTSTGQTGSQSWNWRYYLKRRISCLEKEGFAVIMQDEAFFIHDTIPALV